MALLLVSLGVFDMLLVLLVTLVALLGRRQPLDQGPEELRDTLRRARLQFAVLASAWSIVLAGHLLVLVYQVPSDREVLYLLLGESALLLLVLLFETSLYGPPRTAGDAQLIGAPPDGTA